ncbi:DUF1801 domain-containing protein [Glycomyces harbinensis]|uniref:YdhG-like domain-containing protein n=1 Tax=Glycomyces harbinensis TaxID=58114 RepID=A0A1G7AR38_9ACTN|nr:DUF1801 domain-containing protein [Glycomyces harbinensis]SDE16376.1 hypothetical protein SAMN05216270_11456 [Glycomyces harbinensis]
MSDTATGGFSPEERAAMKARAKEVKAEAKGGRGAEKAAADEAAVLTAIAEMAAPDDALAARVHELVTTAAPSLSPKLWYGQPAYAKDGKVVCFFRSGLKDKERYSSLGFSAEARLDDDSGLWPTAYAVTELTAKAEAQISALVKKAAG